MTAHATNPDPAPDSPIVVPERAYSKREELITMPQQATSLVEALGKAAADPRTDMDKMERLFAMHQTMVRQQAEAAFNDAMARAQAKIVPIANNAYNDHTRSGYAKLAVIAREITPIIAAEGLSLSYDTYTPEFDKDGKEINPPPERWHRVIAIVSHSAGHTRRYHFDAPLDDAGSQGKVNKTGIQAMGSTVSYARRYLACMIFNVATFDDDDGNGNGNRNRGRTAPSDAGDAERPRAAQPQRKAQTDDGTPATDSQKRMVKAKLEHAALSTADMKKKFGFEPDGMTKAKVNDVLDWIRNPIPTEA